MRVTYSSSSFPSLATSLPILALVAIGGCGTPAPTGDAGTDTGALVDTGGTGHDGGRDAGNDAGPIPLCTGAGCDLVGIELMAASTCVLRSNGQVDCWGRGQDGELGDGAMRHSDDCRRTAGEAANDCSRVGVTVSLAGPAASIASRGSTQMCAILETSSEVWCWGGQMYKLGSNLEHLRFAPEHLAIAGTPIADGSPQLGTSFANVCWITSDAHVQCIGSAGSGRLGDGTFNDATTPVTALLPDGVTPITGALEVDTQGGHTCARTADHLYCWGNNHYSQLGLDASGHQTCGSAPNVYDCSNVALDVTSVDATTVTDIQLGDVFSCVLHSTGHVQCWGGGQTGGLGTGDIGTTVVPVEPMGLTSVDELRVVDGNACAVTHDGHVYCWGPANVGQIGDGTMVHAAVNCVDSSGAPYDCQLTPSQVAGVTGAVHVGVGEGHGCAVTSTSEVWCWGDRLRYQLGDEMRPMPSFSPVRVIALGM